jgi:hypothetical protein
MLLIIKIFNKFKWIKILLNVLRLQRKCSEAQEQCKRFVNNPPIKM